jgi:hypothetical protein
LHDFEAEPFEFPETVVGVLGQNPPELEVPVDYVDDDRAF